MTVIKTIKSIVQQNMN